jgi:hypothetical protein
MGDKNVAPMDDPANAGEFEILDFIEMERGKGSWLNHCMLEASAKATLQKALDDPLWDSERMKVTIFLNSSRIIHKDFEQVISYFVDRMTKQKLQAVGFDDFQKAVQDAAKALIERTADGVQDKFHELQNQLSQLTELTAGMVEREYAAPFKFQTTDKMIKAGLNALHRHFPAEPEYDFQGNEVEGTAPDFHARAIEEIYRAMITARDEPEYKVKLPRSYQPGGSDYTVQEISIRRKMLDEVEESLRQQGIAFEPMPTNFEKMGDV